MNIDVENINPISVEVEPKYSVTTTTGADVEFVDSEYIVHAQKKEYQVVSDSIYIPRLYDDAPQWMKDIIGTVVDVKTAVATGNLNDALEALRILATELEVAKNTYTMSIISSNDIDQRINTKIETLNSSLAAADATILNIAQTAVTPEEASAIAINTLSASLSASGAIGSFIANMNAAFADLDSTTAQSINYMESAIEAEFSANAQVINTIRTYVGVDEDGNSTGTGIDGRIISVAEDIEQLHADLISEQNSRASGDTSVTNTVKAYADSIGSGIESKWAYNSSLNINGTTYNSGFGLATSLTAGSGLPVGQSEFWIKADKFKLMSADGTKKSSYSPFSVDTATGYITFNGIVNFSNVSNTKGTGSNLLYNSAPKIGSETKGWYVWTNSGMTVNLSAGWNEWKPTGGASVAANIGGNPSIGSVYDVGQSSRFPVIAGSRYEASAYISAHRSNSYVLLVFFDTAGNSVGEASGNVINYAGSNALVDWGRSSMFTTAPANAATALLIIRSIVTGNDPYCFVANAFAGVAEANQTTPSNWSEGTSAGATYTSELSNDAGYVLPAGVANAINTNTTTINGSKITTGSINAAQIAANSVTADKIASYSLTTGNATIQDGMINNAMIGNAQITNAKIADLSVSTLKIANNAVTIPTVASNPSTILVDADRNWITLVSASIYIPSGSVIIVPHCLGHRIGDTTSKIHFRVVRDNTQIYTTEGDNGFSLTHTESDTFTFNIIDTPGDGTHTYYFQAYCYTAAGTVRNITLSLFGAMK